jgi:type IV pilus assembly protein PilQ
VLVENGGTVVIGGIFSRDENNQTNRVPLLGDIPLLGNVFRNTAKRDNKTELLIFVTPRILKDRARSKTNRNTLERIRCWNGKNRKAGR